jgi:hypothetical protein
VAQVLTTEFRGVSMRAAVLLYAAVGALVASRRPRNPIGWLFLAIALSYEMYSAASVVGNERLRTTGSVADLEAVLWLPMNFWLPSFALWSLLFLYFPNGRLVSPRWRALAALTMLTATIGTLMISSTASAVATRSPIPDLFGATAASVIRSFWDAVINATLVGLAALAALSLLVRLRRSRGEEAQQLKWVVYAVAIAVVLIALFTFPLRALDRSLGGALSASAVVPVPIATAIAIFRYRLFDIDVIIRRTLVYGALSIALALTYVVLVVVVQAGLRPFTAGSELAVAASTLLTLALVQPMRQRIQAAVDRRFYRSRYDGARTLDAFTVRMRDQVDLDAVRREVLDVVGTTLRPAHASVWLRGTTR